MCRQPDDATDLGMDSIGKELERLAGLLDDGHLSQEEYESLKARLLGSPSEDESVVDEDWDRWERACERYPDEIVQRADGEALTVPAGMDELTVLQRLRDGRYIQLDENFESVTHGPNKPYPTRKGKSEAVAPNQDAGHVRRIDADPKPPVEKRAAKRKPARRLWRFIKFLLWAFLAFMIFAVIMGRLSGDDETSTTVPHSVQLETVLSSG